MARETKGRPAAEKKLEQYGVWVKVKPREVAEGQEEASVALSDLEQASSAPRTQGRSTLTAEEENLLDELDSEMSPRSEPAVPEEEPLLADTELPDIESAGPAAEEETELTVEELPELDEEPLAPAKGGIRKPLPAASESEIEVTLSEDKTDHFDDLAALETELASVGSATQGAAGSSAQILSRIEEELRSIRSDLTQLRSELSGLRGRAGAEPAEPAERAAAQGGFFDEEEDETIALTGDELDNILNTAEVTEEAAEAATAQEEEIPEEIPVEEAPAEPTGEAAPLEDILSYETPEAGAAPAAEPVEDLQVEKALEEEPAPEAPLAQAAPASLDEGLVLAEEPASEDEVGTAELEELPSELVLEDLGGEKAAAGAEQTAEPAGEEAGSETIDLETLDIGEEPRVINAVPEQVEDLENLTEAEAVLEEEPAAAEAAAPGDVMSDDVDLEALAAEAAELDDDTSLPSGPSGAAAAEPTGEIEIPFEAGAPTPSPEADAQLEQILDAEEVPEEGAVAPEKPSPEAGRARPASAGTPPDIPDNLKDEIRTVLKYMDHLLEALPDDKIQEFASSEYFVMYKTLFEDLGLGD